MKNKKTYLRKILTIAISSVIALVALQSCLSPSVTYRNEVDVLIRDMNSIPNFSIILYDMDYQKNTFSSDVYRHKYQIIIPDKNGEITVKDTDWMPVSEE